MLFLMLIMAIPVKAQGPYNLAGDFNGMSFTEFVKRVEKQYQVKFFFKSEWIKDLKIKEHLGCIDLRCILDRTFSGTSLHYLIEESGHIIITENYAIKVFKARETDSVQFLQPGQNDLITHTSVSEFEVVEIGDPAERFRGGQVTLSGYITDVDTKETLAGVTVFSRKLSSGTISNQYGFYTISLPRGNHLIEFTLMGMKPRAISVNLYEPGEMNIEMKSDIVPLKAVVITSEKSITLQRFEVGAERINIRSFKLLPTTLGETDILKSILLIPGVKSVGEGSAGFNVRGGTADQNLILLYGAPVYNSAHFFGFFSAVNSDIIREVTLYKGGIPSRYGGRISSVLDIVTKDGNRKKFGGSVGISPVTTHVMVEGPIIKDTLSYIFAARSTYSNWILGLVNDPAIKRSKASYYDLNGKINYDLNKNNKLELSGYRSQDDFRFNFDSVYRYSNQVFVGKWRHFFNTRFFLTVSLNNSTYRYSLSSSENPQQAFRLSHGLSSSNIKADFNLFSEKHELNAGIDLSKYLLHPGEFAPNGDSSVVARRSLEKENAWESALYFEDKISFNKYFSVSAGLRMSAFFTFGPQSVMIYNPEFPKSTASITDTLYYGENELISKYIGPEFRISLNFRLSDLNSFKINYNRTRQYLYLLSNSAAIAPTDIWKLSDFYFQPQIGDQIAAGFYELSRKKHFEFSAEMYYKNIRNMIDFKGGTNIIMNQNIEKDISPVKGKAYGVEITLKKTEGKLNYNIGYTYSRILQKSISDFATHSINSGEWFPANFDKPHDLSVTFNYLVSRRFSFSGNYTLSSGRPITFPVASYILYDNKVIHYSDRNKYRIPDYSRLDLSFTVNGNLRSHKLVNPRLTFSVFNILARKNVYSIYFKRDGDVIKGYKLSVFGRAIPSVTYSFEF
jgi:hypothetical protein